MPDERTSITQDSFLRKRYETMWTNSLECFRTRAVDIDPVLASRKPDPRRGFTLLFRPPPSIQLRVTALIDELRQLEPDQHYYHPTELHVTVLAPFSIAENHDFLLGHTEEFLAAASSFAGQLAPFPISFSGITASPGAIMVQGFTHAQNLNAARDTLREELRARGLNRRLDERYRLETAHMTVARFRQPLRDGLTFAQALERMRTRDFGEAVVDSLELVRNDLSMSRETTECLRNFVLKKD
jgi:2'-5' RNA ligase